jgi:carboxypeptidase family protein
VKKLLQSVRASLIVLSVSVWALAVAPVQKKPHNEPMRTLTGHVLGSQDAPLEKAVVYLKNTKTLAIKTYISDPDGGYRFPALTPNIDYEVYAEFSGEHSDTKTLSGLDARKQLDITLRIHTQK